RHINRCGLSIAWRPGEPGRVVGTAVASEDKQSSKETPGAPDVERLSRNVGRAIEEAGKAMAAYLRPREEGRVKAELSDEIADAIKTLGHLAEYWAKDPQRALQAQRTLIQGFMTLWASSLKRMAGQAAEPAAVPDARDPRFRHPDWSENQFFD